MLMEVPYWLEIVVVVVLYSSRINQRQQQILVVAFSQLPFACQIYEWFRVVCVCVCVCVYRGSTRL